MMQRIREVMIISYLSSCKAIMVWQYDNIVAVHYFEACMW